jgi:ribonuclease HI
MQLATAVAKRCGPIELNPAGRAYVGSRRRTNNTAELEAIYFALRFTRHSIAPGSTVQICYDSTYAANSVRGLWRAHRNVDLISRIFQYRELVGQTYAIKWTWVKGHSNDEFNEMADELADQGANGTWIAYGLGL